MFTEPLLRVINFVRAFARLLLDLPWQQGAELLWFPPISLSDYFFHGSRRAFSEPGAIIRRSCAACVSKENDDEQTGPYFLEET
jgi:hypothetical protein